MNASGARQRRRRKIWFLVSIGISAMALLAFVGRREYLIHHPVEEAEWLWSPENPEPDYKEAMRLFRIAEGQGSAEAMGNIGWLYEIGKGVEHVDCLSAMQWYQQAAANGNTTANWNIGRLYETGCGVNQDLKAAREWYQRAADLNVEIHHINIGKREIARLDRGDIWPLHLDGHPMTETHAAPSEKTPPGTGLRWVLFIIRAPETWEAVFAGAILSAVLAAIGWLRERFDSK
jgi:Sel1 repeat